MSFPYNYREAIRADIIDELNSCKRYGNCWFADRDEYNAMSQNERAVLLCDKLWDVDSITGNASGSYTFNSYRARDYVLDNEDLVRDVIDTFCIEPRQIADQIFDWEYWDVSIRCYLLSDVLGDMANNGELFDLGTDDEADDDEAEQGDSILDSFTAE